MYRGVQQGRTGLSPRVRGNHRRWVGHLPQPGSIPACAGEPSTSTCAKMSMTVYPRVCGGTWGRAAASCRNGGLSPRVRGNPLALHHPPRRHRSIPACAGEPRWALSCSHCRKVYPGVCGGTFKKRDECPIASGLSPRVRGNLDSIARDSNRVRSIPACAGEPSTSPAPGTMPAVYPRVCGGTGQSAPAVPTVKGLSPRVRGNHEAVSWDEVIDRSIPACAGEPTWTTPMSTRTRVYPRVCGGTYQIESSKSYP